MSVHFSYEYVYANDEGKATMHTEQEHDVTNPYYPAELANIPLFYRVQFRRRMALLRTNVPRYVIAFFQPSTALFGPVSTTFQTKFATT